MVDEDEGPHAARLDAGNGATYFEAAAKVIEAVVQAKTGANIEGAVSIEKGGGAVKGVKDDGNNQ